MGKGIIFIALVFSIVQLFGQKENIQFKHFNTDQGLSSNQVRSIFKDSRGYIWIGTVNGLNRFDGFSTKVFRKVKGDTTSLQDNTVNAIYEDYLGKLWIITTSGLSIYDPKTESFSADHELFHKNINLPSENYIKLFTDEKNNFWLVHRQNGLYKYDVEKDSIYHASRSTDLLPFDINDLSVDIDGFFWIINRGVSIEVFDPLKFKVINRYIDLTTEIPVSGNDYKLFVDKNKHAWIYINNDEKGVYKFDSENREIIHYSNKSAKSHLSHDNVSNITSDNDGNILISTDHGGLNSINLNTGELNIYENEVGNKNSLSQNSITSTLCDNDNVLWIGTYKKGVNYYHPDLFKFTNYTLNPSNKNWLTNEDVNTFAEDKKGNLWIGTNGGGLIYFDRTQNTFLTYRNNPSDSRSISSDVIVDVCIDHNGGLWIGTYIGGLNYFNGSYFTHYVNEPNNPRSLPNNSIWSVFEDSDRNLWIGTLGDGISMFDRETKSFSHFSPYSESSNSNFVMSIAENTNKNIWFATANGIDMYDKQTGRFMQIVREENSSNTISTNSLLDICCDNRGWVWIATREGLNLYRPELNTFTILSEADGLIDDNILTVLEDNNHNMWVSTPQGLSNLIVAKDSSSVYQFIVKNYDEKDGLHGKDFNEHAAFKTNKGELIFGGADGFSIFNPANLSFTPQTPKVAFSSLKVQNKEIEVGSDLNNRILLPTSLNHVKNITFNYDEKTFTIGYSAINFIHPIKTKFHYKLEGFNNEWTLNSASIREATYTNLHPGEYIFRLFASNIDNTLQSEEIQLKIVVLPPFWRTKWAYSLYLILVLVVIFYTIQTIITR
ncbi:MAG: triple tyrosine motif-containing protein [Prolixibacteraceae bacterium]|jgi:ligand-binding sensor domain-containing protein|nr:triple tyrosine motif-containing protein [Prolixibacteraceae bacterium]